MNRPSCFPDVRHSHFFSLHSVALAIYYHIKNRDTDGGMLLDIFDEKLHPLSKSEVPLDYDQHDPEQKQIYRFVRTLFSAAQLTAECAIVTLVYLERLLTYAEIDICPGNWKRIVLGAILLASKVWDDQAVWNVDYCQILKDITVEDMNELERQFLELLQFNINVPSSVYAKYYFDLRSLSETNNLSFPLEPLSRDKAQKLEAISRLCDDKYKDVRRAARKRSASMDNLCGIRWCLKSAVKERKEFVMFSHLWTTDGSPETNQSLETSWYGSVNLPQCEDSVQLSGFVGPI
ncbi:hypothetical protein INR49_001120, partial [Caranx melampygus]